MKKITAMLMALTIAALSLTSCSNDEGTSSVTEQNVSGLTSESETFVTTSTTEEITEDDNSLITADTREELAKGLLEAICAGDKDTVKRYGVTDKIYASIQTTLSEGKANAGLSESDEITVSDFEIYFYGPNYSAVGSATDEVYVDIISQKLSSIDLGTFVILFNYDTEVYYLKKTSNNYSYSSSNEKSAINNGYASRYEYMLSFLGNAQLVS